MKNSIALAAFLAAVGAASALAAPPHVHGIATLDVAVSADTLQLSLDSPLDNLVGFEHAPNNARESQAIREMARHFSQPDSLFAPSAAARCVVKSVQLSSPVIDPQLLAANGVSAAPTGASHEEEGHADLDAQIVFRCERPGELKRLDAKIFGAFPGLRQLDAQVVTTSRQSAAKLTAKSNAISF
jgi:hypothetical protein